MTSTRELTEDVRRVNQGSQMLLSGNEAVALAARDACVALGTGYPGTPSTEILERFSELGGRAQWAPNEKVALDTALGAAFAKGRALVTMKHVGLNVAADPFFTAAYTGVSGALIVVSADDPGMASSQNEQDSRYYAVAAGVPMLEPSDSQEAYDFTLAAVGISERWELPVLLRLTTRVCHSKTIVRPGAKIRKPAPASFERRIRERVMIPAFARAAHKRLRDKLGDIAAWNETSAFVRRVDSDGSLGVIASGVAYMYAREAAPEASTLKLGLTHPLPVEAIRAFVDGVERCVVVEEGDPVLADAIRARGIPVERKAEAYRFGELNVQRTRRLLAGVADLEPGPSRGRPPSLCKACPYRRVFSALKKLDCIVAGDIGCYTLAVLPPFEAIDSCVCMGASVGIGLGLRHVLPAEQAQRVVSVIGDSTFVHAGITGLVEMVYNPPKTGHVLVILDNGTTAMTGLQEHPGTGRRLDHSPAARIVYEDLARAVGIKRVYAVDPVSEPDGFEHLVTEALATPDLTVIVARRSCVLAPRRIRRSEGASGATIRKRAAGIQAAGRHTEQHQMRGQPTNVVIAGLGGQGVLTASDILAETAFRAGHDVKKSEVHGMSQRGGSVVSDVRFASETFSPVVPPREADFLVVLDPDEIEPNWDLLRKDRVLIAPDCVDDKALPNHRSLNVALLGVLSAHLSLDQTHWHQAIRANLKEELHEANLKAFDIGRQCAKR